MREFKGDWRDLFFGFRIALDLRKIFLSFIGLIFTAAGLAAILFLGVGFEKGEDFTSLLSEGEFLDATRTMSAWASEHYVTPLKAVLLDPLSAHDFFLPTVKQGSEGTGWPFLVLLASGLWSIFIWSKFGGAITRISAVEIAKDERITTNEALLYAKKKYSSYFWAPLSVLVAFFFFYLLNAVVGLIVWIPYVGPPLAGLLSILAFLGGFVMLLIAIGGLFGLPLMTPAVSAEGTDAFDAVSRAFSYVYSRPWQYAFYWAVSGVYGLFSVGFIWVFTFLMVKITFLSIQLGAGGKLDPSIRTLFTFGDTREPYAGLSVPNGILTVILAAIVILLYGLGASYLYSFLCSMRTLMYFILRKSVDNTDMTEVYLEEDEEDLFDGDLDFDAEEGEKPEEKPSSPAEETPEGEEPPSSGKTPSPDEPPAEEKEAETTGSGDKEEEGGEDADKKEGQAGGTSSGSDEEDNQPQG